MGKYAADLWKRKSSFLLSHIELYYKNFSLVSEMVYAIGWNLLLPIGEERIDKNGTCFIINI